MKKIAWLPIMQNKRPMSALLPIFNKGKRARHALMSHPNNVGEFPQTPTTFRKQARQGQENAYPISHRENYPTYPFGGAAQVLNRAPSRCHFSSEEQYTETFDSSTATGNCSSVAQEPVETARLTNQPSKPSKRELRVLTATAQGIEHWSQYSQHTKLLFEVYGVLASVGKHEGHAQQFVIRTADSPLECIFWEMEQKFPLATAREQGLGLRVVGDWDFSSKRLKCYSIRKVTKEEERTTKQCVAVSDRHMRRMVEQL